MLLGERCYIHIPDREIIRNALPVIHALTAGSHNERERGHEDEPSDQRQGTQPIFSTYDRESRRCRIRKAMHTDGPATAGDRGLQGVPSNTAFADREAAQRIPFRVNAISTTSRRTIRSSSDRQSCAGSSAMADPFG